MIGLISDDRSDEIFIISDRYRILRLINKKNLNKLCYSNDCKTPTLKPLVPNICSNLGLIYYVYGRCV